MQVSVQAQQTVFADQSLECNRKSIRKDDIRTAAHRAVVGGLLQLFLHRPVDVRGVVDLAVHVVLDVKRVCCLRALCWACSRQHKEGRSRPERLRVSA